MFVHHLVRIRVFSATLPSLLDTPSMRWKVPWSELSALGVLYAAIAARAAGRPWSAPTTAVMVLALAVSLVPRAMLRGTAHSMGSLMLAASGLAAVALAITGAGLHTVTPGLGLVAVLCASLAAGGAVAVGMSLTESSPRGGTSAWIAAVLTGGVTAGWVALPYPWLRAFGPMVPVALLSGVLCFRYGRTWLPEERARLILPAAGAGVGTVATLVGGYLTHAEAVYSRVFVTAGVLTVTVGLCLGVAGMWLAHATMVVRYLAGTVAGCMAATLVAVRSHNAVLAGMAGAVGTAGIVALLTWQARRSPTGRLIEACRRAASRCTSIQRVEDLASAVLEPLREASGDLRSHAALWVLETETRYVLDISGAPHAMRLSLQAERALLAWLRGRPSEIVFADALRPQQVRKPEVRPVLAVLEEYETFAAVPLLDDTEPSGVLLIPRGRRRARPTYHDAEALRELARQVSGALALALALHRARVREEQARTMAREADARRIAVEAEHEALRARTARVMRAVESLEDGWIGYGEAMRSLDERLRSLASSDDPVALIAEPGTWIAAVARRLHRLSPRAEEPCVFVDASMMHPRDSLGALVGIARTEEQEESVVPAPGWLEIAGEGMLVIMDAQALGHDAQRALLDALRTGTSRRIGDEREYPVRARVVVTLPSSLADSGLPAELCDRLRGTVLTVPALRDRGEDLETLVLLGIDRACRVLGRPAMGISREALAALRAYHWPRNERQLFEVLEYAVARAKGARILLEDLPVEVRAPKGDGIANLVSDSVAPHEHETYEVLERRILEAALMRSGGNKSEAARALGLARTTFLDKLRKYGLRT